MSDKSFFRLSRPRIILFAVVVLSLVLCAAILASCNKPAELTPSDTETVYDMRLDYQGGDKATLSADILYFNTLYFHDMIIYFSLLKELSFMMV